MNITEASTVICDDYSRGSKSYTVCAGHDGGFNNRSLKKVEASTEMCAEYDQGFKQCCVMSITKASTVVEHKLSFNRLLTKAHH